MQARKNNSLRPLFDPVPMVVIGIKGDMFTAKNKQRIRTGNYADWKLLKDGCRYSATCDDSDDEDAFDPDEIVADEHIWFFTFVACWSAFSTPLAYLSASASVSWYCSNFLLTLLDFPLSIIAISISVSNQPAGKSQCSPSALSFEMNESHVSSFPCLMQRNLFRRYICIHYCYIYGGITYASIPCTISLHIWWYTVTPLQ